MIIDGINISSLGLKVLKVSSHFQLPRRKKVLPFDHFTSKDIVFEEFDVVIKLKGKYNSLSSAVSAVDAFKTLLKSAVVHDFSFVERSLEFNGVIRNGIEVSVVERIVLINLNITVTQCTSGNLTM